MLVALGGLCILVCVICEIIVLIHAFKASVGQGFLCLCIWPYLLYYAFARFTHPKKNLILAGLLGGAVLGGIFYVLGGAAMMSSLPQG